MSSGQPGVASKLRAFGLQMFSGFGFRDFGGLGFQGLGFRDFGGVVYGMIQSPLRRAQNNGCHGAEHVRAMEYGGLYALGSLERAPVSQGSVQRVRTRVLRCRG